MATLKTKKTQVLEIKASELDRDVLDILEGIVELTPVEPTSGMWLIEMKTLLDTLDDDGLEDDYEDAFKDKWETFVKEVDKHNTISKCKYLMIVQNMDDVEEGDVSDKHSMENINFLNYYHCSCGETWHQEADSMCNDLCPSCNKEIEPYESIDLVAKKTNNKPIYKRYRILKEIGDGGMDLLEDYNDYETCYEAFEAIRENGYHVPENAYDPTNVVAFNCDKVVLTMDVELWEDGGNHLGFETIDYIPIVMHSGKVVMEYCVTAIFDDEPDANHTKWFSTLEDAKSYIESIPDANAAIGKRLTLTEATKLLGEGKEIVFIFDDGTESVWGGGEIDEVYADQPMAVYI